MIKENILNFTAVISLFALTGSTAAAEINPLAPETKVVVVTEIAVPEKPYKVTGLTELDKMIVDYEGQEKILEKQKEIIEAETRLTQAKDKDEEDLFIKKQTLIDQSIKKLISYVGVTSYGFGDSPEIWDCSGLTLWHLGNLNIEVVHSATAQVLGGSKVSQPISGDLVGFQKPGVSEYFHIGVYIGGGLMVHSSNPQKNTNIQSVVEFAEVEKSKVVFVRY